MVSSIITQTENLLYEDGVIQIVSGKKKTTTSCPCNNSTSSTQNLTGYATQSWVQSQGYLTQNTLGNNVQVKVENLNFETDEENRQVISGEYLLRLETRESGEIEIGDQLSVDTEDGIVSVTGSLELNGNAVATQSWVQSQDYLKKNDEQIRIVSGEGDFVIGNQDMTGDGFQGLSLNEGVFDLYGDTVNVKSEYFQFNGDDVATQEWVDAQGYLTEHQSLAGYVTSTSLANTMTDYATRNWVDEEVEQTLSDGGYATESWVENQDYVNTTYLGNYYVGKTMNQDNHTTSINGKEISISDNDGDRIYLTSDEFTMSKTGSDKTSVNITRNGITLYNSDNESVTLDYNKLKSLDGDFATQQDISGKMDKSAVWTGTEAQWNALSDTQKASYTIALIKE